MMRLNQLFDQPYFTQRAIWSRFRWVWMVLLSLLIAVGIICWRSPTWSFSHPLEQTEAVGDRPPNPPDNPFQSLSNTPEDPFWVDADAGTVWNIFGLQIVGKVMSAQTNGKYAVVITTTPPGGGPPLHVHQREDELFYILEGTYEFQFGDETVTANQGDMVHLPRQIPHRFRNMGEQPGVTMNTMTPGGFEQFFVDIDQLPKDQPLDRQQVAAIAHTYGLQFLPEAS
ncbi:MAG: cupin domain-containing protein [Leptolyngbyaceae cyanobacterium]